jgi:FKBP-type peptidyl-prolyl cis-trans isomerase 2
MGEISMHTANLGDRVRIQYARLPEPGAAANKARAHKTCEFIVGSRQVFRTLSLGVVGMAPGDRKQLTLQPREAYGAVQPKLIRQIPRARFPQHIALRVGKRLTAFEAASGRRRRVRIVKINPDSVLVDGNHPLAGKVVELEVCLVSIDSSPNTNRTKPQFDIGGES